MSMDRSHTPKLTREDLMALLEQMPSSPPENYDHLTMMGLLKALFAAVGRSMIEPDYQGCFRTPILTTLRDLHQFMHMAPPSQGRMDQELLEDALGSVLRSYCCLIPIRKTPEGSFIASAQAWPQDL